MKKVILFADTGIDDMIALTYALKHPEVDLIGVVSGYGNIDREKALRNVEYLLELAERTDIPVIAGATRPLSGDDPVFFPDIHGAEGLGPVRPPIPEERYANRTNFSKLFQLIKANRNEVIIVNVGRCTSLAIAHYLSPEVMADVKETYLMGGAFNEPGNATEVAEANFFGDPIAANYVCQHTANLTVVPLNVTREALLTPREVNLIDSRSDSPLEELIKPILDFYYEVYQQLEPGITGTPLHDLAALMAALDIPGLFEYKKREVTVEHQGEFAYGESIADFRPGTSDCFGPNCVRIAMEIDQDIFVADVLEILTNHR
ncbi:purine nucleosidase [Halobacillus karajensis]|uniref:Pyrimidine-specific ribonucleoside hydrolase RihA n=1 Tax=Halobacillus karajensis TaxID=195088 RepID=A0A059NXC5_9BACI|nr:nucleoside hydrolase [Halobacillus karajensis]CDQ18498.1 Pyrimidine-specific ribonucleoside hydrolase RihA [Halobacillus karajensis]CDQ23430.1 Pyrimidine-specific ribonucleoside hydrolase RihA [Halobacillus karajensis]CDQ26912.1 Pyrimidine-specific ribonucleoside hydrolase RihA [Halobacillus karajensis]SEH50693.1 purine nucleosidase [Halobacillus karajensis]